MVLFSFTIFLAGTVSCRWRGGTRKQRTMQCQGLSCTWYVCTDGRACHARGTCFISALLVTMRKVVY